MVHQTAGNGTARSCILSKDFVDSNIILYSMDKAEPAKQRVCQELLTSYGSDDRSVCVLSTQVMQETYVAATKKLRAEPDEIETVLRSLQSQEIVTITPQLVFEAIECSRRQQLSLWDALIMTAAASAGCDLIWTEDMNDGQIINGVRIVNPLASLKNKTS